MSVGTMPEVISHRLQGVRKCAIRQPLDGRESIAVATIETVVAEHAARFGDVIQCPEPIGSATLWAGTMNARVQLFVCQSADRSQDVRPASGRLAFDLIGL